MTDISRSSSRKSASLERGRFSDGMHAFAVRASSSEAPDSFQVYANGDHEDIVLVVSGLNSGALKAAWGHDWQTAGAGWREWVEVKAFMVFYNGERRGAGETVLRNG